MRGFCPEDKALAEKLAKTGDTLQDVIDAQQAVAWSSGAASVDMSTCNGVLRLAQLTQNSVLTISNITSGKGVYVTVKQDGTGLWTLSLNAGGANTPVTINSGAGVYTCLYLDYDGTAFLCQDMSTAGVTEVPTS